MDDWEQSEQHQETWFPSYQAPVMQHAAHPVATEVTPGYDGSTSWFKYSDAVEEWCALTKVETKRRGPAIAARLKGRAELFKERLDRNRLKDPETGITYLLSTMSGPTLSRMASLFFSTGSFRCSVATVARQIFSAGVGYYYSKA